MTDEERQMLELERSWWKTPGAKDELIRERFGMTPTRYYQRLNTLLDNPEAMAAEPVLVRRLRRIRDARVNRRASR